MTMFLKTLTESLDGQFKMLQQAQEEVKRLEKENKELCQALARLEQLLATATSRKSGG